MPRGQGTYGTYDGDYYSGEGRRYAGNANAGGVFAPDYYEGRANPREVDDERDEYRSAPSRARAGYVDSGRRYEGASAPGAYADRYGREIERETHGGSYRPGAQTEQYRGRGPRGYQRSDERICEDVCERLTDDEDVDASNVEVSVTACEVTLAGAVSSRQEKRRAAFVAEEVSGVKDVHNRLRIAAE